MYIYVCIDIYIQVCNNLLGQTANFNCAFAIDSEMM